MTHIYYYSWSGKTKYCAEAVAGLLKCGITEIVEVSPRKKSIFGFLKSGYEAAIQKTSEIVALPAFNGEQIVLAFPIWAGKIPPAVNTALQTMDFKDYKVLIINTMGGEAKSNPGDDIVRNKIIKGGGSDVAFIRIVTGRYSEGIWKNMLRNELKRMNLIG